ncbi:MAG: TonB-dependent receptor [Tannerellaceae bacterium]|nr:TonB-dependent receptor [Tannerellaceae bacterium]
MIIKCLALLAVIHLAVPALGQAGRFHVSGYVRDADGNPIELAIVQIKNTVNGTMTNEKGFYSITVAPGDSVKLLFSCLGYNKVERILPSVTADMRLNVQMNLLSFSLREVGVTASRRQTDMMSSLQAGQARLLADPAGGSIESLVVTLGGVSSSNEMSSQYSVRGGSYDENIVYVNGLEVFRPLLIRSGEQEGLSFVNPDLTEEVKFAAGGFEARYGDKMSSVLDIAYKKPQGSEGSASIGLLGANAYLGGSSGSFTHVTGLRFKTARLLLGTLETKAEYDPVFVDLQTYMAWIPAPKWELNFLGNIASNTYRFIPQSRSTSFGTVSNVQKFDVSFDGQESDRFQTQFGALTLKHAPAGNIELGLQASAFNSTESETYDISASYFVGEVNDNDSGDALKSPLELGNFHEHARNCLHAAVINIGHYGLTSYGPNAIRWGLSAQWERIADRISEWEMRDSAGYSQPHKPDGPFVYSNLYSDNEISGTRFSGYLQDVFKTRSRQGIFTFAAGLRGSYWTYNREIIISPRASIGFIPNFNQNLTLRLASGLYYQPPFYKELRRMTTDEAGNRRLELNPNLQSQRSIHFIIGGDYAFRMIDRNFKLSAEAYYKSLDRLNPYTVDNVKLYYYGENCASGYAAGIDLKLFGEFVPGRDSWLSLSLMKAEQEIRGVKGLPLPNNPGYNISLYFSDYFPGYKRLTMNLRGMLSGRLPVNPPYIGYENGYYRTTPYRRVDIGLAYQLAGGRDPIIDRGFLRNLKNIWLGVDLFNLLGIQNASSYLWITDTYSRSFAVPNYLTGRQLSARILVEF